MEGGIMTPLSSQQIESLKKISAQIWKGFFLFGALLMSCAPALALHLVNPSQETGTRGDHVTMEFGMGGTNTVGSTSDSVSAPGFNLLAGIGYRLNEHLSIPFEYMFDVHGVQTQPLQASGQPEGFFYYNTFAINPIWTALEGKYEGLYLVGGGGLSTKEASYGYDVYSNYNCGSARTGSQGIQKASGCSSYQAVATLASTQPMLDIGGGLTMRFNERGRGRIFLEARYVKMYTPIKPFPGFSTAGTDLIPITIGVRF